MPTLKDFGAFRIVMYFDDENPPHVHVIAPDFEAKVRIADAEVFRGEIPKHHRKRALAWIAENKSELEEKWRELSN